jgi:hypothetical protein
VLAREAMPLRKLGAALISFLPDATGSARHVALLDAIAAAAAARRAEIERAAAPTAVCRPASRATTTTAVSVATAGDACPSAAAAAAVAAAKQLEEATARGGGQNRLSPGVHVTLQGLQSAPELNGRAGVVEAWDAARERWAVRLCTAPTTTARGGGQLARRVLSLRAANLTATTPCRAPRPREGTTTVIAGGGEVDPNRGGLRDGAAATARFNQPNACCVDPADGASKPSRRRACRPVLLSRR